MSASSTRSSRGTGSPMIEQQISGTSSHISKNKGAKDKKPPRAGEKTGKSKNNKASKAVKAAAAATPAPDITTNGTSDGRPVPLLKKRSSGSFSKAGKAINAAAFISDAPVTNGDGSPAVKKRSSTGKSNKVIQTAAAAAAATAAAAAAGDDGTKMSESVLRVLKGTLVDLPALSSKIVRVFTSSTFTDTTNERNALMENVYPKIKEFCREKHGLEFQVVDMRWGVRDESTDDHMTTELCMKEIENCKRLSMGPNFVVLLGQKYGYRPLPSFVPTNEFSLLCDVINTIPSDVELLKTWYKEDTNAVPAVYVLQPISSILPNFNNKRIQRLMEIDQNKWFEIMFKLQKMMRKAAQVLAFSKKISKIQKHNYFMSVTEREVRHGIIDANNTKDHCLAYIRQIKGVNMSLLRFSRNFVDITGNSVDTEAEKFLATLRDTLLPEKIAESNVGRFEVEWSGREGLDKETHTEYLTEFCENFHSRITELVDRAVVAKEKLCSDAMYSETLQHLHMCNTFCKLFQGREDVVSRIETYIKGSSSEPLVLWGESGCGKTSLLAKAYSQVCSWLPSTYPVLPLRFLGTSPDSSSIFPLVISLCRQIASIYDEPLQSIPDELSPLILHFKNLLLCATPEKPLMLFLDSLDQLSGADGAHQLAWLPIALPPHVKVVVSTLPNYYGILDKLHKMVQCEDNFLQILPLGENLSSTILTSWLTQAGRTVSQAQWKVVQEAISKCNLPLYVKLVFDDINGWRSYNKPNETKLAFTINDSIVKLFNHIENQHGKVMVSHALGYLTAAKSGLTEAELEDLLSLDEKVLNDVYQYHLPPVRRIPPLLWTRIRNDLPQYFAEREADGVNVIGWYHRQFVEASKERYFRNMNFVSEIHSQIADYFLGVWGGGNEKPFVYSELQRQRFHLDSTKGQSDRKVPEQPLYFTDSEGNITRYNLRKLSEMPYHLLRAHRIDDLYSEVFFNFRFLHAKLSCMPLQQLLADLEDCLEVEYDRDVKLLADALRLSASVLSHHPDMLGPQVVGRLLPYYNSHDKIQLLIRQCDTDGLKVNALVPSYHCMHTPGGPLQYSLEGHSFAPFGIGVTSDAAYLVSVSSLFVIWDLSSGDVFREINPGIQGIMQDLSICHNDKYAVSYTNNNQVVISDIMTGEFRLLEKPVDSKENILGTGVNSSNLLVWTSKDWSLYELRGATLLAKDSIHKLGSSLMHLHLGSKDDEKYMVWRSDLAASNAAIADDMMLEIHNKVVESFIFHSAIAVSADKRVLYAPTAATGESVGCYKYVDNQWQHDRTLATNIDKIFALNLSNDENYLAATVTLGYKLWDLRTNKLLDLHLPTGLRNIPTKNQINSLVEFTKNNEFMVSAVRKNLYLWDVRAGNLVKTLDAHFGRIIAIEAVTKPTINKIISSSIDKSIKVWNIDNILEDVHDIDRHDKPVEALSVASNANVTATTTRNCVGIWNLERGTLLKTLSNSAHSSIVTHAVITSDTKHVVSAESGNLIFWDVDKACVIHQVVQRDVQQLILSDDSAKVTCLSQTGASKASCSCFSIPSGDTLYSFDYTVKRFGSAIVTSNALFIIIPAFTDTMGEVISMYHAKTGTKMDDMAPKFPNYKGFDRLVAMPNEPTQIALIDDEKGSVWDIKKKALVRTVQRWNGVCTSNGKYGLYAPARGGLELINLKTGSTLHVLIPRVAEGVFSVDTQFTRNDLHVIYYHSGHKSIRVFRVSDGRQIADYKAHAEVNAIASTQGGASVVLGVVDGSVVALPIADPEYQSNIDFLSSLPSRKAVFNAQASPHRSPSRKKLGNGTVAPKLAAVLQVARISARVKLSQTAHVTQRSRACVLS